MTPQSANTAVLLSTAVTLGSTTGYSLTVKKGLPTNHVVVGGLLAMTGCAILVELDANLGGYLAIAIATTAFMLYGLQTVEHYFVPRKQEGKSGATKRG